MFIKIFLRTLIKKWKHSLIMVGGLSVVLSACMYIYLEVSEELSADKFLLQEKSVFRINYHEDEFGDLPLTNATIGPALHERLSDILRYTRLKYSPSHILTVGENAFNENKIFYADSTFFEVLRFQLKHGDARTALREPNSVVLSEDAAIKYFGTTEVLEQTLLLDNSTPLKVTGVVERFPAKSHLQFDFLLPFDDFEVPPGMPLTLESWQWISFMTYLSVENTTDIERIEREIRALITQHSPEDVEIVDYPLQPLRDIYFGDLTSEGLLNGSLYYVYGLMASGIVLLLMAVFNYTNLATALSLTRAREIGIKKTLGSTRFGILTTLSGEMMLTVLIATGFALALLFPLAEILSSVFSARIDLGREQIVQLLLFFVPLSVIIGMAANAYPSLIIASFTPSKVLKGDFKTGQAGAKVRQVLIGFQFLLTIVVITISLIVNNQIAYLANKDLGYDKSRIMILKMPGHELKDNFVKIRNEFLKYPSIVNVSASGSRLDNYYGFIGYNFEGVEKPVVMNVESAYPDFFSTIGVPVIAGREFDIDVKRDTLYSFIINRSAAALFNWTPESALNRTITTMQGLTGNIVGVVEDYHAASLYRKIDPMVIYYPRIKVTNLIVAMRPGETENAIASVRESWTKLFPDIPFDYSLLTSDLQKMYRSEIEFRGLIGFFSMLTIFIACVGVYGIVSVFVQHRMKEYSVRIILGAESRQLLWMLLKPFAKIYGVALLCSLPVSIYYSAQWLSTFSYKIELTALPFVLSAVVIAVGIGTLLITKYFTIQRINPSKTLRDNG